MSYKPPFQLMKLGTFQSKVIIIFSILVMALVFVVDLVSPSDIRLHTLYIFPLVAIALHCEQASTIVAGVILATTLQLLTFYIDGVPITRLVIDLLISCLSAVMAVMLARAVRDNHLRLEKLSSTDGLTGLHNRRSFEAIANLEIERQKRYGGIFSLVVIDLDGFKKLNDSRGHHVGDMALKLLGKVLQEHSRQPDTFARLGGDEFAILMPNTPASDCGSLCQNLCVNIARQMAAASFPITASIGFTSFELAPESISVALQKADNAMYAAKARGRNCTVRL